MFKTWISKTIREELDDLITCEDESHLSQVQKNLESYSGISHEFLKEYKLFPFGGFLRDTLHRKIPNDLDLLVTENFKKVIGALKSKGWWVTAVRQPKSLCLNPDSYSYYGHTIYKARRAFKYIVSLRNKEGAKLDLINPLERLFNKPGINFTINNVFYHPFYEKLMYKKLLVDTKGLDTSGEIIFNCLNRVNADLGYSFSNYRLGKDLFRRAAKLKRQGYKFRIKTNLDAIKLGKEFPKFIIENLSHGEVISEVSPCATSSNPDTRKAFSEYLKNRSTSRELKSLQTLLKRFANE